MIRPASFLVAIAVFASCSPKHIINHNRPVRPLSFPADHAAHYDAKTEWWYYTGHLTADDGSSYGFELTFFKRLTGEDRASVGLVRVPAHWIKEVGMLAHFAVTDCTSGTFTASEMTNLCRRWRADADNYHVAINGWSARLSDGSHHLKAHMKGYQIDLRLSPLKPPAFHGPGGIIDKGVNVNYYYSYTRMKVEGTITVGRTRRPVEGLAWMDHEFGSMDLIDADIGWDWFSIQLDDGTELMIYLLKENTNLVSQSGGTFIERDGRTRRLSLNEISVKPTATWTSPKTGAVYPSGWEIAVRPLNISLRLNPVMAAQELTLRPVTYWEGAVTVSGLSKGRAVSGRGYVELVGYDPSSSFGSKKRKNLHTHKIPVTTDRRDR